MSVEAGETQRAAENKGKRGQKREKWGRKRGGRDGGRGRGEGGQGFSVQAERRDALRHGRGTLVFPPPSQAQANAQMQAERRWLLPEPAVAVTCI